MKVSTNSHNQRLISNTGEFLSRKPQKKRLKLKSKKITKAGTTPSRRTLMRSFVRRAILFNILSTVMINEASANDSLIDPDSFDRNSAQNPDDAFSASKMSSSSASFVTKSEITSSTCDSQAFLKSIDLTEFKKQVINSPNIISIKTLLTLKKTQKLTEFLTQKDFKNSDSTVLLFLASFNKKIDSFSLVLHASINDLELFKSLLFQVDDIGRSAFFISCEIGNIDHLNIIFQNFQSAYLLNTLDDISQIDAIKKDMIMKTNHDKISALMKAVLNNNISVITKILDESVSLDQISYSKDVLMQCDQKGNSPFSIALSRGNKEILAIIINAFKDNKSEFLEIIKHQNNKGSSALFDESNIGRHENIAMIISLLTESGFTKDQLKEIIILSQNSFSDNPFLISIHRYHHQSAKALITPFQSKTPEDIKAIQEIVMQKNKSGYSSLNLESTLGKHKYVAMIISLLTESGFTKDQLKEIIMHQDNTSGNSALINSSVRDHHQTTNELIAPFQSKTPEDVKIIQEIVMQENKYGNALLHILADTERYESIAIIISLLIESGFTKDQLQEVIMQKNKHGNSLLHILADTAKHKNIAMIISLLIESGFTKDQLQEIIMQKNKYGLPPLMLINAITLESIEVFRSLISPFKTKSSDDINRIIEIVTDESIDGFVFFGNHFIDNQLLSDFISMLSELSDASLDQMQLTKLFNTQSSQGNSLSLINNLLLSGNDELIAKIIKLGFNDKILDLTFNYQSFIPKLCIYYLEAFRKIDLDLPIKEVKYYYCKISSDEIKDEETTIEKIELKGDRCDILITEIIDLNGLSKKVILSDIYTINYQKNKPPQQQIQRLKNAINVANNFQINEILIGLDIRKYDEISAHAISLKLTRNTTNNRWDILFHDPNQAIPKFLGINENSINELFVASQIPFNQITQHENIIPNYKFGSCDIISTIVLASMIIGEDHVKKLTAKCREFFTYQEGDSKILSTDRCIQSISEVLNKEIKVMLEQRFTSIQRSIDTISPRNSVELTNYSVKQSSNEAGIVSMVL